jgi:hypothetical protein
LSAPERNLVWRQFRGVGGRVVRDPVETPAFELELVADLHTAAGRWPEDRQMQAVPATFTEACGVKLARDAEARADLDLCACSSSSTG